MAARRTLDELVAEARAGAARLTPREAYTASRNGALLVDVRSADEQARQSVLLLEPGRAPLRQIGFSRATDVAGGGEAWQAAGLPVEPYPR